MMSSPDDQMREITVAALYRFARFDDPAGLKAKVARWCADLDIRGTLLLATEGINGTVSGLAGAIEALVGHLRGLPGCADLEVKYSHAAAHPFARMKVKVKREIVTMGVEGVDPVLHAGIYVDPKDWNALISDPATIVIDTRNDYEVAIGTFAGAMDPGIASFREFPAWFASQRAQWEETRGGAPRIAMFCTGGIRCEKSTALARHMGCDKVYHLKGGILKYLEETPEEQSLWRGNCFVFDERVSVSGGLALTSDALCRLCGRPYHRDSAHECSAKD